jgi:UDP-4-amino-4,6-dideoxy-N-acetyl-beta-L-altrosamine transaminase
VPSKFLPYGRQHIDEGDIAAVVAALKSDWLTTGPKVEAFEAALAKMVGASSAVVCSSGTAALHLAAIACDLAPRDAVIVPAMTFAATANAVRFVGAEVVFCDVDPTSGLATPDTVAAALQRAGGAAKSLFVVHLNGQTVDMVGIGRVARDHGVSIVEDACHAIGGASMTATGTETAVGSCVDSSMAVFSFHPVKTITSGEGGAITCRDAGLASRLKRLRNHGITRDPGEFSISQQAFDADGTVNPWYYEMAELGYNYRLTDIQCALGQRQLERLSGFVTKRRQLAAMYDQVLAPLAPTVLPIRKGCHGTPAWHLYVVLIDFEAAGVSRSQAMNALKAKGIGTQVHYIPVNRQPYYLNRYGSNPLPGADSYYARCLSLPLFPGMTHQDVHDVVNTLAGILC